MKKTHRDRFATRFPAPPGFSALNKSSTETKKSKSDAHIGSMTLCATTTENATLPTSLFSGSLTTTKGTLLRPLSSLKSPRAGKHDANRRADVTPLPEDSESIVRVPPPSPIRTCPSLFSQCKLADYRSREGQSIYNGPKRQKTT